MAIIERLEPNERSRIERNPVDHSPSVKPLPQVDLRDLYRTLWGRRTTVISITLIGVLAALAYAFLATPKFNARALLVIETRELNVVDIDDVVSRLTGDEEEVSSEVEIIGSRRLADRTVSETGIEALPEFNRYLRPDPVSNVIAFASTPVRWFSAQLGIDPSRILASFPRPSEPDATAATPTQVRTHVIDSYLSALSINQVGRSQVISVDFTSRDPALAATVVNTLADQYILDQLESKYSAARMASEWLSGRISELRTEVEQAEQRISDYRADKGILQGAQASIVVEQLSALAAQRSTAQAELARAEAREGLVRRLAGGEDSSGLLEVINSPVIQRLKTEETALRRRLAEIQTQYGPRHPISLNVTAELEKVGTGIAQEIDAIQRSIAAETEGARERLQSVDKEMFALRAQIETQDEEEIGLRALERDADATKSLFATFLERYKETSEQDGLAQPDARVVQYADVPVEASWPRKGLILGGAGIVSFFLGIGLALVAEVLDRRVLSPERLEQDVGVPAIGLVPSVGNRRITPQDYAVERPSSAYAETLRSVHTSLFSDTRQAPKSILIASAVPSEGKSTLTVSLARLVSGRGHTVVLLDCDMRRPNIHRLVGRRNIKGLAEYLVDETDLDELIQDDPKSGMKFISPGRWHTDSVELFRSERMITLLKQLESRFDLVIVDSPPVLSMSDARVLSGLVDTTVMAIRWRATKQELVQQAIRLLSESGARIGGLVITRVNTRRFDRYNYGTTSYLGKYKQYYVDA